MADKATTSGMIGPLIEEFVALREERQRLMDALYNVRANFDEAEKALTETFSKPSSDVARLRGRVVHTAEDGRTWLVALIHGPSSATGAIPHIKVEMVSTTGRS